MKCFVSNRVIPAECSLSPLFVQRDAGGGGGVGVYWGVGVHPTVDAPATDSASGQTARAVDISRR